MLRPTENISHKQQTARLLYRREQVIAVVFPSTFATDNLIRAGGRSVGGCGGAESARR